MTVSTSIRPGPHEVIIDYTSPAGATATQIRGTLLVNSLDNLRTVGLFDRYLETLAAQYRETIQFAIAASWVPMEVASAHYAACDNLDLTTEQTERLGELMASRIVDTFLSSTIRATRKAGLESVWLALGQNDRLWERMYQGGGLSVVKTGPKDLIHETHGLPLVTSRYWRAVYVHYIRAITNTFTRVAYVKPVRPSIPDPHRIAMAISWV